MSSRCEWVDQNGITHVWTYTERSKTTSKDENDLMDLMMLRTAVQCYVSFHYATTQTGEKPDYELMNYWRGEMARLAGV